MPKKKVIKKKNSDEEIFRMVFIISSVVLGVLTIIGFVYYLVKKDYSFGNASESTSWIPFIGVWVPILAAAASNREKEFEKKYEKLIIAMIVIGGIALVVAIVGLLIFLARRG